MWVSVMRKCLCKQKHCLPYMGEVLHALMLIDMPLAGCVQKASGVAKSGAVSVSRCSFCVDEAAGEDGLDCCPASSTLPHTSSATAASAARCRLSAPLDNRGACSGPLECEIVCRACVSTGGMLRIPFRRRAVPLL